MFFQTGPGMMSGPASTPYGGGGGKAYYGGDLESGADALYPGITTSEQGLRWGFIRKVRRDAAQPRSGAQRS
jgi:hypothetical protein